MTDRYLPNSWNSRRLQDDRDAGFPSQKPPWGIIDVVLIITLVFAMIFALRPASPWLKTLATVLFPGFSSQALALLLLLSLIQSILMGGLVLGVIRLRYRAPLRMLGLRGFDWRVVIIGVVGGLGVFILVVLALILISALWHLPMEPQPVAYLISRAHDWRELLGSLLLAGILAPLSEELYFRGFVYPVIRGRFGVTPAILITSCFFAALHFDLLRFLPIALSGAFFALLCEKTRSLYPAILAHSTWNTLMTVVIYLTGKAT